MIRFASDLPDSKKRLLKPAYGMLRNREHSVISCNRMNMNAAGRLTRPYCQWWQTRKALDHSTEGFMEVVHEEDLYQHELN